MKGQGTRQRVLERIEKTPGIHKSALQRDLGLGWGTVSYHLEQLRRAGRIKSLVRGRQVRLFPAGIPEAHMRWLSALREDVPQGILGRLAQEPGTGLAALADDLGVSRRLIRRHLTNLAQDGLVAPGAFGVEPGFRVEDPNMLEGLRRHLPSDAGPKGMPHGEHDASVA